VVMARINATKQSSQTIAPIDKNRRAAPSLVILNAVKNPAGDADGLRGCEYPGGFFAPFRMTNVLSGHSHRVAAVFSPGSARSNATKPSIGNFSWIAPGGFAARAMTNLGFARLHA